MTHHDKGNFAAKHPKNTIISDDLRQAINEKSRDESITCAAAHAISQDLHLPPLEVGRAIDVMECHIKKCQMGLFGYSPKKKIVTAAPHVDPRLKTEIENRLKNGRLPCKDAWQLADKNGLSRLDIGAICEALSLKISPCQLGAFRRRGKK